MNELVDEDDKTKLLAFLESLDSNLFQKIRLVVVTGTDLIKGNADHIIMDDLYGCSSTMTPYVLYN